MEMMDSVDLPFAQSTSEVDNRFNGWSAPLFKVALCPRRPLLSLRLADVQSNLDRPFFDAFLPEESNFFNGRLMKKTVMRQGWLR